MKVIIFGASGMIGQGALRECLMDARVSRVLSVVRSPTGRSDPKLEEVAHADMRDLSPLTERLSGYDACLFCLGISSVGLTEPQYTEITHDLTISVATFLARINPSIAFIYVSAAGSDLTGQSRMMWARVRGRTENELLAMPCYAASVRPALVRPMHGIRSRTRFTDIAYRILAPVLPVFQKLIPAHVTSTQDLGRTMLYLAEARPAQRIVECRDFGALARAYEEQRGIAR